MRTNMTFESTASPVAYTASGTAVIFGLTAGEFAAYVGAAVAVATFLLNWYYKERAARLQERLAREGKLHVSED